MYITVTSQRGAAFDINNNDSDVSLVPSDLVPETQNSFVGYEIIEGYARVVNVQPFEPVQGVPSLEKTQRHARESTQFWTNDVRVSMNVVYDNIRNKLKVTQDAAKTFFKEFIPSLEKQENREGIVETLQMYIDDTNAVHQRMTSLVEKLQMLRKSLEEDARNYGEVMGEINKQKELDQASVKKLREEIQSIDKEIDELNNVITRKKVEEKEVKRKLAISYGFVWSGWGLIAIAALEMQKSSANAAWHAAEKSLFQKKNEKKAKSAELGRINERIAYLTTLNNEFAKLLKNCVDAIAVVTNMGDAWSTLASNLENIQQRLEKLKANDFSAIEKIKTRLRLHIMTLEKSIDRLNEDVLRFEDAKLVKVPIDSNIDPNQLRKLSLSASYFHALPARLVNAYAQRMHCFDMLKNKEIFYE